MLRSFAEAGLAVADATGAPDEAPDATVDLTRPGARLVVAALERGFILPSMQAGRAGREPTSPAGGAPTAGPGPRTRATEGFFDDLKPGDYVVHHQHGVARYGGMVKRAIGGVERDYLLLEYRGGDKLYVPSDQIDAVRHYTGGETPVAAPSRRGASGRRPRPGCGRWSGRSPRSSSCSTASG